MRSLLLLAVLGSQLSVSSLEVSGTVKDPSGAVLPGATIEATVAGLSVATAVTGPDGRYRIALAAATRHQLRARMNGFADQTFAVDITVNPGYTVSWLGGEVRVGRDLAAYLRIDNLTDAVYESVLGYPGLPRSVVAGVRFNIAGR